MYIKCYYQVTFHFKTLYHKKNIQAHDVGVQNSITQIVRAQTVHGQNYRKNINYI